MSVLKYRHIGRYKYQLMSDFCIDLSDYSLPDFTHEYVGAIEGLLFIKSGYCWDGATCAIDTRAFMVGSLVHDALYQMMRLVRLQRGYRKVADVILRDLCIKAGMSKLRASYVYRAVRLFGGRAMNVGVAEEPVVQVVL